MLIFLAIMMGPALGFMLYALSQFWREARRVERRPRTVSCWIVTPVTSFPATQRSDLNRAASSGADNKAGERNLIFITQPLSRRSGERDVA
jgi:hypothetical protein